MSGSPAHKRLKMEEEKNGNISSDMFESSGELHCHDSDESLEGIHSEVVNEAPKTCHWSGVPLDSLPRGPNLRGEVGNVQPLPPPQPNHEHTVTVKLPIMPGHPEPYPSQLKDLWDESHVRLPWSKENLYPIEERGTKVLRSRWQLVLKALTSKELRDSRDLERAVMSYNTRYKDKHDWSFDGLHHLFSEVLAQDETDFFFSTTLPGMISLLVSSPEILTSPLPLLQAGKAKSITLSQQQIAVLLVNAFFCTFPRRNVMKNNSEFSNYPMINFNALFGKHGRRMTENLEKLKCLFCYFSQVIDNPRTGLITFSRHMLPPLLLPSWATSTKPLRKIHLSSKGNIEDDGIGMLQADFANKFIGGGVLRGGLVQEEIRFTICPELIGSLVFTEALRDNEAMLITGAEQFCTYSGYSDTFRFEKRLYDPTEVDSSGRKRTSIVAMDAIKFSRNHYDQFRLDNVERELNKAFVAFHSPNRTRLESVATGNWGCGAFKGDPRLKFLLQAMAASEADRDMAYFTFGDADLVQEGGELYTKLAENKVTVGHLFDMIRNFNGSNTANIGQQLFIWISEQIACQIKENIIRTSAEGKINGKAEALNGNSPISSADYEPTDNNKVPTTASNKAENLCSQGLLAALDEMEKGNLSKEDTENTTAKQLTATVDGSQSKILDDNVIGSPKQTKITNFFGPNNL